MGVVFGFSFSELVVVVIVALVVMGPKDLPKMLRKIGRWAGQLRRAAADLRAQSGIDDALRSEGLAEPINEIRKLARGELDAVRRDMDISGSSGVTSAVTAGASTATASPYGQADDFYVVRDREYPRDGADSYAALPDNAIVYIETMPKSAHYRDPLYRMGDANAELPPEPEPTGGFDTETATDASATNEVDGEPTAGATAPPEADTVSAGAAPAAIAARAPVEGTVARDSDETADDAPAAEPESPTASLAADADHATTNNGPEKLADARPASPSGAH